MGKKKKLNSSLFSFALSITTYDFLRREDWERVREKILMEDIVNTVGEFLVGWEGGLVRALDEPKTKFSARSHCTSDSVYRNVVRLVSWVPGSGVAPPLRFSTWVLFQVYLANFHFFGTTSTFYIGSTSSSHGLYNRSST